jgi:TolB-like protein
VEGQIPLTSASATGITSLAVLPFTPLNDSPEAKQQGIGLTDTLITRLSNLKSISVRSITSVADLDPRDPIASGKLLNVDAVVVGTIYRSGDKTRVSARILKLATVMPFGRENLSDISANEYENFRTTWQYS